MSRKFLRKQLRSLPDPNSVLQSRPKYKRLQNRAAAIRDYDIGAQDLWTIAHLHKISFDQILSDYNGDPLTISRVFDLNSTRNFEQTFATILKDIHRGIPPELAGLAHKVPYVVVKQVVEKNNNKEVAIEYINDVKSKLALLDQSNQSNSTNFVESSHTASTMNSLSSSKRKRSISAANDDEVLSEDGQVTKKRALLTDVYDSPDARLHHMDSSIKMPAMQWDLLRQPTIGLSNNGQNICYINAALQCLASTPPLVELLLSSSAPGRIPACPLSKQGEFCSVCNLAVVMASLCPAPNNDHNAAYSFGSTSARSISDYIDRLSPSFLPGRQEDSSLFLLSLLDHCKKCLSPPSAPLTTTSIDQIFGVNVLSSVQCFKCLTVSAKVESHHLLAVEVDGFATLSRALSHFVAPEILRDDNAYQCNRCNDHVPATKRLSLSHLPPVVLINLKRSGYGSNSHKLTHKVEYGEWLDLRPYVSEDLRESNKENESNQQNSFLYQLYAVTAHIGDDLRHGHYISYVRDSTNIWFCLDDAFHRRVQINEVLNNAEAFVLFYGKSAATSYTPSSVLQPQSVEEILQQRHLPVQDAINLSSAAISTNSLSTMHSDRARTSASIPKQVPAPTNAAMPDSIRTKPISHEFSLLSNLFRHQEDDEQTAITTCQSQSTISVENQTLSRHEMSSVHSTSAPKGTFTAISIARSTDNSNQVSNDIDNQPAASQAEKENLRQLASVASGTFMSELYETELSATYSFRLTEGELAKMNTQRREYFERMERRRFAAMGIPLKVPSYPRKKIFKTRQGPVAPEVISDHGAGLDHDPNVRQVNIEYLILLLPHLKHYNSVCGLCVRNRRFGRKTVKPTDLLIHIYLRCNGPICPFSCDVYVLNSGHAHVVSLEKNIRHRISERISRPIRGSMRAAIKQQFKPETSVYRLHAEYDKKRTPKEKAGFNYDATGKSKKIFKKIKSEAVDELVLGSTVTDGVLNLHDRLLNEINCGGIVKGAMQCVQLRPLFCVYVFTEASLRLYDALVCRPDSVMSWDATGGLVQCAAGSKQILYYEMTITHPNIVSEDSLVPLTFMLSQTQTLLTITQWLQSFKESYRKIFPGKSFPRPALVLSDRAQVLLQAGLRVFNDESNQQFLERAYRIVTGQTIDGDFEKTNVHACMGHMLKDIRKLVNRYVPEDTRELAMWSMALLINTNTWSDMLINWHLICSVFLNHLMPDGEQAQQHCAHLLARIEKILGDPNSSAAIASTQPGTPLTADPYEFSVDEEPDEELTDSQLASQSASGSRSIDKKNKSIIVNEERQLNSADSSFKHELQAIYKECLDACSKTIIDCPDVKRKVEGIRQWLSYVNKNYIPTVPIWSNLLMGNLSRYATASVRSFHALTLLSTHDQRTTANSERRMGITKRTQLGNQTRIRPDIVLAILTDDMCRSIEAFAIAFMAKTIPSGDSNSQRFNPVEERWNKSNRRGRGHYTKPPEPFVAISLQSVLVAPASKINDGLSLPHLPVPMWLSVAINLLLSIETIRRSRPIFTDDDDPLLIDITDFLQEWIRSRDLPPKRKKQFDSSIKRTVHFDLPVEIPANPLGQVCYLLNEILIPLVQRPIRATKSYHCPKCQLQFLARVVFDHISMPSIDEQSSLMNQLTAFFSSSNSDLICDNCSTPMNRSIALEDCPPIVLLSVNRTHSTSSTPRKPPPVLCLHQFLKQSSGIGCPSSSIYDVVAFLSIMKSGGEEKLVSVSKSKQRWQTSANSKLIGDGEALCQLFACSRLVVLERIRRPSNVNFLYAIAQCCSIRIDLSDEENVCLTLHEAVKRIERESPLQYLRTKLWSSLTTSYQCHRCGALTASLSAVYEGICLYEPTPDNTLTMALPLLFETYPMVSSCVTCNAKSHHVSLSASAQVHHRFPDILMYHLLRPTLDQLSKIRINLVGSDNSVSKDYAAASILLVDEYIDSVAVIKLSRSECPMTYRTSPYESPITLQRDEMNDLYTTSRDVIVFFERLTEDEEVLKSFDSSCMVSGQASNDPLRPPISSQSNGSRNPLAEGYADEQLF